MKECDFPAQENGAALQECSCWCYTRVEAATSRSRTLLFKLPSSIWAGFTTHRAS